MKRRNRGQTIVWLAAVVNIAAWLLFPPLDDGRTEFSRQLVGELAATTAMILFAIALVLATRARWLEPALGGLDKMYRVHREVGAAAFVVLLGHVAVIPWRFDSPGGVPAGLIAFAGLSILVVLSIGPRLGLTRRFVTLNYRSWRRSRRLIGFFFIFSGAHMLLVDSVVATSPLPFALVMVAFVVGVVSFLYVLLVARLVRPSRRYLVEEANRLGETTLEVVLNPVRKPLDFRSGQFVFVRFQAKGLREPHPFTVSSSPGDDAMRLVIKASGDYTTHLYESLENGHRSRVEGAYGMLDYRRGGLDQVWIAGGIGVTPFLSWLRDAVDIEQRVDFFYTVRHSEDALFVEDISAIAADHERLDFHLTISSRDGSLTPDKVASSIEGDVSSRTFYMCGPLGMIAAFEEQLIARGVDPEDIHYEEFSFR